MKKLIILAMLATMMILVLSIENIQVSNKPAIIDTLPPEQGIFLLLLLFGFMIWQCIRYSRSTWYQIHIKENNTHDNN